ncbi:unnamed protein product [Arabis nemorensis]|uniref:HTH TFE/IIEalpha-type domain-containing protein n=1 Tax=Arabis nemorensis TaxID=586526 RepID=A0A565CF82_9BRAS|nr:unnamed protein product [Arabis nemorensis]
MEISVPVQTTVVVKPFIELVRLIAMSFYDDYISKSNNQKKSATNDNRGIAVVVLNALTRRQWVSEEDLAMDLNLGATQIRKIIRHFEEEKLVTRYQKKETVKRAKPKTVAATTNGQAEKFRPH